MDSALLEYICCPLTHQPLRMADAETLARVQVKSGRTFEAGLVREDGTVFYPVANGIPLLLPEEGITL